MQMENNSIFTSHPQFLRLSANWTNSEPVIKYPEFPAKCHFVRCDEFRSTYLCKWLEEVPPPCNQGRVHQGHLHMWPHTGNTNKSIWKDGPAQRLPHSGQASIYRAAGKCLVLCWVVGRAQRSTNKRTGTGPGREAWPPAGHPPALRQEYLQQGGEKTEGWTPWWVTNLRPGWECCSRNLQICCTCKNHVQYTGNGNTRVKINLVGMNDTMIK